MSVPAFVSESAVRSIAALFVVLLLLFSGLVFFVAPGFFNNFLDFLFGVLAVFRWSCYGDFCFVSLVLYPDVRLVFCLDSSFVFSSSNFSAGVFASD